jgi:hypothetical protein
LRSYPRLNDQSGRRFNPLNLFNPRSLYLIAEGNAPKKNPAVWQDSI